MLKGAEPTPPARDLVAEIESLRAERDRLREALQRLEGFVTGFMETFNPDWEMDIPASVKAARTALAHKEPSK